MKLTKAQREALGEKIIRIFDVWGGDVWETAGGKRIAAATAGVLLRRGFIKEGETVRPFSGHRETHFPTTEAGRAALAKEQSE